MLYLCRGFGWGYMVVMDFQEFVGMVVARSERVCYFQAVGISRRLYPAIRIMSGRVGDVGWKHYYFFFIVELVWIFFIGLVVGFR